MSEFLRLLSIFFDLFLFVIHRFQYLTQDLPSFSHPELAEMACKNGIKWLQLRVKEVPFDEYLYIAQTVKHICDRFQTTLIINDNVEICKLVNAAGVHLGKTDMSIAQARKILGETKIIGGTANTLEDIMFLHVQGAHYVGLGPYKFTTTKKNLSSVLGLDAYSKTVQALPFPIPIIAIGGIQLEDVKPLINTGVFGVAVSSAINLSTEKEKTIANFLELF